MKALDEVIELYSCSITNGTDGQKVETYALAAKVFGRVSPSVNESVFDYNQEAKLTARVEMYRRQDLTTRWRVKWRGKDYGITSITYGERISPLMTISISEI